jgi:hypothetical protein
MKEGMSLKSENFCGSRSELSHAKIYGSLQEVKNGGERCGRGRRGEEQCETTELRSGSDAMIDTSGRHGT